MFPDLADKPVGRPGFGAAQDDTALSLRGHSRKEISGTRTTTMRNK